MNINELKDYVKQMTLDRLTYAVVNGSVLNCQEKVLSEGTVNFIMGEVEKQIAALTAENQKLKEYLECATDQGEVFIEEIKMLTADKKELVEGMIDFMNSHGGGEKKCGHDYSCVCAWENLKSLIAKHGK